MSTSNELRIEDYLYLRDATCDVLSQLSLQDSIGMRAGEIIEALQTSFPVERRYSRLVLPDDQLTKNNIGIHPLTYKDFTVPNPHYYLDNPVHKQDDIYVEEMQQSSIKDMYAYPLTWAVSLGAAAMIVPKKSNLSPSGYFRPLIRTRSWIAKSKPPIVASIIAHEVDHALSLREIVSKSENGVDINSSELRTGLERRAYPITATILQETGCVAKELTLSALMKELEGQSPKEAAMTFLKTRRKYVKGGKKEERIIKAVTISAYGAMALTNMFGKDAPYPTTDEVIAYKAAGFSY